MRFNRYCLELGFAYTLPKTSSVFSIKFFLVFLKLLKKYRYIFPLVRLILGDITELWYRLQNSLKLCCRKWYSVIGHYRIPSPKSVFLGGLLLFLTMFLTGILSLLAILGNYLQPSCFHRVKAREASEIIVELSRVLVENNVEVILKFLIIFFIYDQTSFFWWCDAFLCSSAR